MIQIVHCPEHGRYAIAVNQTRVVGGRCCGQWTIVEEWPITRETLLHLKDSVTRAMRKQLPPRR